MEESLVEDHDQILLRLKRTRKAFLVEYFCSAILLAILLLAAFLNIPFPPVLRYFLLTIITIALISTEINRWLIRYAITPSKIMAVKGFFKLSKKNVYFHSLAFVPDINVHQSRMQRLLGYGNIHLYGVGAMSEGFEMKDVNRPKEVLMKIEELIRQTRKR